VGTEVLRGKVREHPKRRVQLRSVRAQVCEACEVPVWHLRLWPLSITL
jgi:hypothetical protein